MSFTDLLQKIKNIISFPKENNQKRRAEQPAHNSNFSKYPRINKYFPVNNHTFEDHQTTFTNKLSMAQKKENTSGRFNPFSSKISQFTDLEFSDNEDDETMISHNINQNSRINSASAITMNCIRRPVLTEDNCKRNPIVYNIPIQIERKSKPPPLRDVRIGNLLDATCAPRIFSTGKSVYKSINNEDLLTMASKNMMARDYIHTVQNNSKSHSSNIILPNKHKNSLSRNTFNLQEREGYLKLLSKTVPKLYKIDSKENYKRRSTKREMERIDLTGTKPTHKSNEVIDLVDDDDDYQSNLLDDDVQIISTYKVPNRSQNECEEELYVEPVNTLKQKLELQPKLQISWLNNFNGKYTEKSILRKKQILEEEENVRKISEETVRQEKLLNERLKNIVIDAEPIFLDEFEAEEEEEFPEFSKEDTELIKTAIYGVSPDEVLISKFNMNITRRDINTLVGDCWLNDEVINFYMNLLMERGEERSIDGYPKVYSMNTFFIPRLSQSGYSGVRRWTRKVDIFRYDIIPVPVHVGGVHWCMAIIHLKNKTIKYYDSMGQPNPSVLSMLEHYLQEESLDKKKVHFDTSDFIKESIADVPRQMNGSDCGVFSCMFAEYIARNKEITFTQQHMHYFRQKMILEIVRGKLLL